MSTKCREKPDLSTKRFALAAGLFAVAALAAVMSPVALVVPAWADSTPVIITMEGNTLKKGGVDWTPVEMDIGSGVDVLDQVLLLTTGTYQLGSDIVTYDPIFSILCVGDVTLDLNGYGILCKGSYCGIASWGAVTLNDSRPNAGPHYITLTDGYGTEVTTGPEPDGAHLTVNGGYITGNGNGVTVDSERTFTMTGGTICGNRWHGLDDSSGIFTMTGGTICHNRYSGVVIRNGIFTMRDGSITNNNTSNEDDKGGGVFLEGKACRLTIEGGTIENNTAAGNGGGVYLSGGQLTIKGGTIKNNTATEDGGGVYISDGFFAHEGDTTQLTIEGGTIKCNTAAGNGGGVYLEGKSQLIIKGGTIKHNMAAVGNGGGVYLEEKSQITTTGGTVENNMAAKGNNIYQKGGNIYK